MSDGDEPNELYCCAYFAPFDAEANVESLLISTSFTIGWPRLNNASESEVEPNHVNKI